MADKRDLWEVRETLRRGRIVGTMDYGKDVSPVYVRDEAPLDLSDPRQGVIAVCRLARDERLVKLNDEAEALGIKRMAIYDWALRGVIYSKRKPLRPEQGGMLRILVDPREAAWYCGLTPLERRPVNLRRYAGISWIDEVYERQKE